MIVDHGTVLRCGINEGGERYANIECKKCTMIVPLGGTCECGVIWTVDGSAFEVFGRVCHKTLLMKYMNHVSECEGMDFVSEPFRNDGDFTELEWNELLRISRIADQ